MEKQYLKIGKTEFFVPHFQLMTKAEFKNTYRGVVEFDLDMGYLQIQKRLQELGLNGVRPVKKISKKSSKN